MRMEIDHWYKNQNIRINCVSPGGIEDNQDKRFISNYKKHCNTKGLLDSDDLNGLINFLISEDSKYINGQNIIIDDGWSLWQNNYWFCSLTNSRILNTTSMN